MSEQRQSASDITMEGATPYNDHALWKHLVDDATDIEYCSAWLQLNSRIVTGVRSGVVVLSSSGEGTYAPVAIFPADSSLDPQKLAPVIEQVIKERKGVAIREESGDTDIIFCIAFPIRSGELLYGVAALRIESRPSEQLQSAMRQLQWGTAWIENRILRKEAEKSRHVQSCLNSALEFAAVALEEQRFEAAATSFATLLATRLQCDRVSIGFLKGRHVRVRALSHSSQFKDRMNLIRAIGFAMDESIDQEASLVFPVPITGEVLVYRAHAELSAMNGDSAVCTIPFFNQDGNGFGAMTLERSPSAPFDSHEVELCEGVSAIIGPILDEKRRLDRPLVMHAHEAAKTQLSRLFGPRHLLYKLVVFIIAALTLFFCFATGDYRISAKTTIEGAVIRAITAPFDGFIAEAPARPGDVVKEGQPLARLDDRELKLERLKLVSQREQYARQYREALATSNRSSMGILDQQINQVETQLRLLDDHIQRSILAAPFDAVVVSGDLSQSLGSPVERSKLLFEVAPLRDYRVRLHVDEHRIRDLKVGQKGVLILNSLPDQDFSIAITKITPISVSTEGKNNFMVEASLDQPSERLRPGMEGVGKVYVERRLLIWIWTHELIDWLRLWVWSWLP